MTAPSPELWRARALRYVLIYLLLACVLVGLRYQSRDIRPDLLALRAERETLTREKQFLELEVQAATSTARVREWAVANGMIPFSRTQKESATFESLPRPVPLSESRPLEVVTRWK